MADDDGLSSTPWGRPGGSGRRGDTPAPVSPPGGVPSGLPPEGSAWTPPQPSPVAGGSGVSGRALVALIAVVVTALVVVGLGVFLVTSGDDGGESASETRPAGASESLPEESPGSGPVASVDVGEPEETGPGSSLDLSGSEPSLPPELGTGSLSVPDGFPQPDGAVPDALTGGLTVPGEAAAAQSFYEGALPGAGYTVEPADLPGVAAALAVTGDGISGQLLFLDLGLGSTSVLWVAG